MVAQPKTLISVQDYLVRDQNATEKLEYCVGTIVAQAGATARHNLIVASALDAGIHGALHLAIKHTFVAMPAYE